MYHNYDIERKIVDGFVRFIAFLVTKVNNF